MKNWGEPPVLWDEETERNYADLAEEKRYLAEIHGPSLHETERKEEFPEEMRSFYRWRETQHWWKCDECHSKVSHARLDAILWDCKGNLITRYLPLDFITGRAK